MKKSYLALGAIAIALSSCSNDSLPGPSAPNQGGVDYEGAEDVVTLRVNAPVTADVADSRTRGTGTVGSVDGGTKWQNEDIYVLMTTNDVRALEAEDIIGTGTDATGWGFTSFCGVGPVLKRQFDGSFWARPKYNGSEWTLDYTLDANEFWNGIAINRFYPLKGASDFFAYYIDDAAFPTQNTSTLYPLNQGEGTDPNAGYYPTDLHNYPTITKNTGYMTVGFEINGTQDLLFGRATRIGEAAATEDTDAAVGTGFSAASSRGGKVPSINMQHMLSRLTFSIAKGKDLNSQTIGTNATFDKADKVTINKIEVTSEYKGTMLVAYDVDAYSAGNLDLATPGYVNAQGKVQLAWAEATGEPAATPTKKFTLNTKPDDWSTTSNATDTGVDEDGDPVNGKGLLQPLTDLAVEGLGDPTVDDPSVAIGEAMFVKPGVSTYKVDVTYTYVVREAQNVGDTAYPELTETKTVTLNLVAPSNGTFQQGYSYNAILTVYGLEPITAEVQLTAWGNGGTIDVGQDGDPVNP